VAKEASGEGKPEKLGAKIRLERWETNQKWKEKRVEERGVDLIKF
jgi:hypothetical protein